MATSNNGICTWKEVGDYLGYTNFSYYSSNPNKCPTKNEINSISGSSINAKNSAIYINNTSYATNQCVKYSDLKKITLKANTNSFNVDYTTTSVNVTLTTEFGNWEKFSASTGVSFNKTTGGNSESVTISFPQNTSTTSNNYYNIWFRHKLNNNIKIQVSITQNKKSVVEPESDYVITTSDGQTITRSQAAMGYPLFYNLENSNTLTFDISGYCKSSDSGVFILNWMNPDFNNNFSGGIISFQVTNSLNVTEPYGLGVINCSGNYYATISITVTSLVTEIEVQDPWEKTPLVSQIFFTESFNYELYDDTQGLVGDSSSPSTTNHQISYAGEELNFYIKLMGVENLDQGCTITSTGGMTFSFDGYPASTTWTTSESFTDMMSLDLYVPSNPSITNTKTCQLKINGEVAYTFVVNRTPGPRLTITAPNINVNYQKGVGVTSGNNARLVVAHNEDIDYLDFTVENYSDTNKIQITLPTNCVFDDFASITEQINDYTFNLTNDGLPPQTYIFAIPYNTSTTQQQTYAIKADGVTVLTIVRDVYTTTQPIKKYFYFDGLYGEEITGSASASIYGWGLERFDSLTNEPVYMSVNQNIHSSTCRAKIVFSGFSEMQVKVVSSAEQRYDYAFITTDEPSKTTQVPSATVSGDTVLLTTHSNTTQTLTVTGLTPTTTYTWYLVFRKDGSGNSSSDTAYCRFYIDTTDSNLTFRHRIYQKNVQMDLINHHTQYNATIYGVPNFGEAGILTNINVYPNSTVTIDCGSVPHEMTINNLTADLFDNATLAMGSQRIEVNILNTVTNQKRNIATNVSSSGQFAHEVIIPYINSQEKILIEVW